MILNFGVESQLEKSRKTKHNQKHKIKKIKWKNNENDSKNPK